jgi:GAF domain-containing protein/anti-sigma regulatory factor (Ser/Thr protein kinase)
MPPDLAGGNALVRAAFHRSPFGQFVLDSHLRVREVNDAFLAMIRRPREKLIGRTVKDTLPEIWSVAPTSALRTVLDTGRPIIGARYTSPPTVPDAPAQAWSCSFARLTGPAGDASIGIGAMVVDVTDRQVSEAVVARVQRGIALINEASQSMGETLDVGSVSRQLAEIAMPDFADVVVVELRSSLFSERDAPEPAPDELRRTGYRSLGPKPHQVKVSYEAVEQLTGSVWQHAWRTGTSQLVRLDDRSAAGPAARLREEDGPFADAHTVLVVSLAVRDEILGVAAFARSGASLPYDDMDLQLASDLATRAAMAIDNARRYGQERATALALQRSLLPESPPRVPGVEAVFRYLPGSTVAGVGGDWFDVIALPCGRTAMVIGDVMGRGLRAAVAMGQLRTAVRTLATLDLPSEDMLTHLDELAANLPSVSFATCIYAVFEPATGRLCLSSAGHLPPVLVPRGGTARLLDVPPGTPLGVGGGLYRMTELEVPPGGALFALFTDGLVESRDRDLDQTLTQLRDFLSVGDDPPDARCDAILARFNPSASHDDVALLLARLNRLSDDRVATWQLPASKNAPTIARAQVRAQLARWDRAADEAVLLLVVTELVTNAVRHATPPIGLRLQLLDDQVVCEVSDADGRQPRQLSSRPDDDTGRGLQLVDALASGWGSRPTTGGKVVWSAVAARSRPGVTSAIEGACATK